MDIFEIVIYFLVSMISVSQADVLKRVDAVAIVASSTAVAEDIDIKV